MCCLIVLNCKKTLFWMTDATGGLQDRSPTCEDVVYNWAYASSIVLGQTVDFVGHQ
jgi:hypothetical protein